MSFKILVVDDDFLIRQLVTGSLALSPGFQVLQATNGQEAIREVQANQIDLMVLDVSMPEMDGPTVLQRVRELQGKARETPIVFLTGKTFPHEIEWLLGLGARGVITKPFRILELPDRLRSFLTAAAPSG